MTSPRRTGDERGPDLLSRVREVCRLWVDQDRSTLQAEISERTGVDGVAFDHLVVPVVRGHWQKELVVGTHVGAVDEETLRRFGRVVADRTLEREPEMVYDGPPADPELVAQATSAGVWLRSFAEYQQVWDHTAYVRAQTRRSSATRRSTGCACTSTRAGPTSVRTSPARTRRRSSCGSGCTRPDRASRWCSATSAPARRSCCAGSPPTSPRSSTPGSPTSSRCW